MLPTRQDAALDPASSPQLATASTQPRAKKEKSTQTLAVPKSKKVSVESSAASESANTLTSSSSKKKSLRALIEASKSKQVSEGSPEGPRSTPEDPLSASSPFLADAPSHRITAQTKTNPNKDSVNENHSASLSTEAEPKGDSKLKVSKVKKAAQSASTTKDTSSFLDTSINLSSDRLHENNNMLLHNEDLPEDMFLKLGNGHQARITLQDVKATLRRANAPRQSGRPSILSQIKPSDDLRSKIQPSTSQATHNQQDNVNSSASVKPLPDQLPRTGSQPLELKSAKRKGPKSKQESLLPVKHDSSPQPGLISAAAPLLLSPPSSTSLSLTQLPSPHLFPRAPRTLPVMVETSRADDGLLKKSSQLSIGKEDTVVNGTKGTERSLGQVRLRELPDWLVCRAPSHPRDVVKMVQRGWQWYYSRYIDVRKGGVAGLGMLLAGYCVLSYVWSYPHIKRDRWRKYH
ncbi:uncharacterized protein V6R79_008338 [Siganus canaliculatus]